MQNFNTYRNLLKEEKGGNITSYTYDRTGMRTSKTSNNSTTKDYWERGYISNEAVGSSFTANNYIGVQGKFARESNDTTNYMLKNGHGDVVSLVSGGAVTKTYDYDAYGVERTSTHPTPTHLGIAGSTLTTKQAISIKGRGVMTLI